MENLIDFKYKDQGVRTITKDGVVWFIAKDVCDVLELGNSRQALSRLDDDEKNSVILNDGTPGNPEKSTVNEFGLYNLILGSRKPEAKEFKRWVTHEVLPSIRQNGVYVNNNGKTALQYQGHTILLEGLMNERKTHVEMNREIIKQFKLLENRVCDLEDYSGIFAYPSKKPIVQIGSTQADECKSLYVEFEFLGNNKSFDAMNSFLQMLEAFLVANGYHQERKVV